MHLMFSHLNEFPRVSRASLRPGAAPGQGRVQIFEKQLKTREMARAGAARGDDAHRSEMHHLKCRLGRFHRVSGARRYLGALTGRERAAMCNLVPVGPARPSA